MPKNLKSVRSLEPETELPEPLAELKPVRDPETNQLNIPEPTSLIGGLEITNLKTKDLQDYVNSIKQSMIQIVNMIALDPMSDKEKADLSVILIKQQQVMSSCNQVLKSRSDKEEN